MSILQRILDRVARTGGLAVFDLDSTLFSTQERNFAILSEFIERDGIPPHLKAAARRLTTADMGWNIMDDLSRNGFDDAAHLKELRHFWFERFFRSEYLRHDRPLSGAIEFVCAMRAAGAQIVYLTGRDERNMGEGTRASLFTHGFPLDGCQLRLKPRFEDEDLAFKRSELASLRKLAPVIAAFENEPANANLFCQEFPDADVVFLETVHSPDAPALLPRIVRIKDFTIPLP